LDEVDTFQVVELDEVIKVMVMTKRWSHAQLGKEEREIQKWTEDKGITYRAIFVLHSRHHRRCK
jgi:hypothetical protein